jgi:Pyridine nucleotide-disulphide oxidoreductase
MKTHLAAFGAGPGGHVAASHTADLGMQVTLIDADPNPGGVCTFRGCAPSKVLLHAASTVLSRAVNDEQLSKQFSASSGRSTQSWATFSPMPKPCSLPVSSAYRWAILRARPSPTPSIDNTELHHG